MMMIMMMIMIGGLMTPAPPWMETPSPGAPPMLTAPVVFLFTWRQG